MKASLPFKYITAVKGGKHYVVFDYKDNEGKRKRKWVGTDLPENCKKKELSAKVDEIVASVTFLDVMNNYGDFRADGASKTAKKNAIADYEKLHNLKDGKPLEAGGGAGGEGGQGGSGGEGGQGGQGGQGGGQQFDMQAIASLISKGIADGIKPLTERLNSMDAAAAKATRDAQIDAVAKSFKIPEFAYKGKVIPDDADLNKYFLD